MTDYLTWPDLTARPRDTADATIAYGPDPLQRIDLWRPAGDGPHPVVLMVHGGCWQTSIADRRLMDWVAADRLRTDAAAHRLDPARMIAVGHSAGGHLALWLAARHRLPADSPLHTADPLPVPHVVALGALPDLAAVAASPDNGCGTGVIARLVGDRPARFADTSIPPLLPLGIRQTLVAGREDRIVPYRMAEDYVARARAAGDRVDLHTVPDTGHVELIAPGSPAWTQARALILAALGAAL